MIKINKQEKNNHKKGDKLLSKVKVPTVALLALSSFAGCKATTWNKQNTNLFSNTPQGVTKEYNGTGIEVPKINGNLPENMQYEDLIDGKILRFVAGERNAISERGVSIAIQRGGDIGELIGVNVAMRRFPNWEYARNKGMEKGRAQGEKNGEESGRVNAFYVNTAIDLVTNPKYVLCPLGENKECALKLMLQDIETHDKKIKKEGRNSKLKDSEVWYSDILKEKICLYMQSSDVNNRDIRSGLATWIIGYLNARNIEGIESAFEKNKCLELLAQHQNLLEANDNLVRLDNALRQLLAHDTKELEKKFKQDPNGFKNVKL